ncbi:MAG: hypothetical protein ABIO02_00065 [Patescibacteria group bacterium]
MDDSEIPTTSAQAEQWHKEAREGSELVKNDPFFTNAVDAVVPSNIGNLDLAVTDPESLLEQIRLIPQNTSEGNIAMEQFKKDLQEHPLRDPEDIKQELGTKSQPIITVTQEDIARTSQE